MGMAKPDIFISYRIKDGATFASELRSELEYRGYSVFLDDQDLEDGPFYGGVLDAIEKAEVFLAVLTPGYFEGACNPNDWVIGELQRAAVSSRPIILVNPNFSFKGFPDSLPSELQNLTTLPIHDMDFGWGLSQSMNALESKLRPYLTRNAYRTMPIFVSYTREDKDVVFPFIERLEQDTNANCWIDLEGIETGEMFEDVIIRAIDSSRIVLFMLSDSALQSIWTKREVYYAEKGGKRIVPIVIDGKGLRGWFSFHFGNVDYIDITSDEQYTKLISNLRSWLESYSSPRR